MNLKTENEIKEYARLFVSRINNFSKQISNITKADLPKIILDYMDTATILNYITDRYDYLLNYLYTLPKEKLIYLDDYIKSLNNEYLFFEKFVNGEVLEIEQDFKAGSISGISKEEYEHVSKSAGRGDTIPSNEEMYKMCDWLRVSYYIFRKNYLNKEIHVSLPKGKKYVFTIKEENIAHLLGINTEGFQAFEIFTPDELKKQELEKVPYKYAFFSYLTEKNNMAKIIELQKRKGKPLLDIKKIKTRNYLFHNFGSLLEIMAIAYDVPTVKNGTDPCDTYLIQNLKNVSSCDKSFLGFLKEHACTLQAHAGMYYYDKGTCKMSFATSIFSKDLQSKGSKIKTISEEQSKVESQYEPLCIFSVHSQIELIKKILEEDPEGRNPNKESLIEYHNILILGQKKYRVIGEKLKRITQEVIVSKERNENNNAKNR